MDDDEAPGLTAFEIFAAVIIMIASAAILRQAIQGYFGTPALPIEPLLEALPYLKFFSLLLAILFAVGIVYSIVKHNEVVADEKEAYAVSPDDDIVPQRPTNPKWARVMGHMASDNPGDWKLAVLEADIILDELMRSMGYIGQSIGDMLKGVEPADFLTLNNAWEAHKIRNQIAHEGSDFILTERDARRTIEMYRTVFEEFYFL